VRKKREEDVEEPNEVGEPSEPKFEPLQMTSEIAAMLCNNDDEEEESEVAETSEKQEEPECEPEPSTAPPSESEAAVSELEESITVESSPMERRFQELHLNSYEATSLSTPVSPSAPLELYPTLTEMMSIPPEPTAPEAPAEPFLSEELLREICPMNDEQLSTLYQNHEVAATKEFVSEFFESQKGLQSHPLYELLSLYMSARTKLLSARMELEQMVDDAGLKQEMIWTQGEAIVRETGKCADGVSVAVQHSYPTAEMSEEELSGLGRNLSTVRSILNENLSLHAYRAEVLRLQVKLTKKKLVEHFNYL
jgi:hypothetical protein